MNPIPVMLTVMMLAAPAMAAEMRPFTRGSWQEVVKANAGKPTVVHFWGLTCAPCLTELPHWARLAKERPDMRLVMIAADPTPGDIKDLSATLERAKLDAAESWAFADAFSERLRFEIDPKWRGEMPRTLLIARSGAVTVMSGVADLKAVRAWLDREAK